MFAIAKLVTSMPQSDAYDCRLTDHISNILVKVDVQFPSVVSPGSEFEYAHLDVKGEVENVDRTGGSKNGGRKPQYVALVIDNSHSVTMLLQPSVGAVKARKYP